MAISRRPSCSTSWIMRQVSIPQRTSGSESCDGTRTRSEKPMATIMSGVAAPIKSITTISQRLDKFAIRSDTRMLSFGTATWTPDSAGARAVNRPSGRLGSRSMAATESPRCANSAIRTSAVVVFPDPPFVCANVMIGNPPPLACQNASTTVCRLAVEIAQHHDMQVAS